MLAFVVLLKSYFFFVKLIYFFKQYKVANFSKLPHDFSFICIFLNLCTYLLMVVNMYLMFCMFNVKYMILCITFIKKYFIKSSCLCLKFYIFL